MNWKEIKNDIVSSLKSRGLKDPSIRIKALNRIEGYMINDVTLSKYLDNVGLLKTIDKNAFKLKISSHKESGTLNGAEESIVNEIYYRI